MKVGDRMAIDSHMHINSLVLENTQEHIDNINNNHNIVSNGYYISFAGRITYKTAKKSIEVAKVVPNELFLVETDSPYISPEPLRKEINNSSNISFIIKKLAEVKKLSYEEVEMVTSPNTKRLFKKNEMGRKNTFKTIISIDNIINI